MQTRSVPDIPCFLADAMLGRLARWLRILGYDTAYDARADDHALARQARAEGRILLTRDRELARRRGLRCLFVEDEDVDAQLAQVMRDLGLSAANAFSRCIVCNEPLQPVDKETIRDQVPPYVYRTQERFARCPRCGRIYWPATHWAGMRERISKMQPGQVRRTWEARGRGQEAGSRRQEAGCRKQEAGGRMNG